MNRVSKIFLVACIVVTATSALNAQITINHLDLNVIPEVVYTKMVSDNSMEVNLGEAGADRHWDFTGIELEVEYHEYSVHPEGMPGAEYFPTANYCGYEDATEGFWELYVFAIITEDFADFLGMAAYVPQMDSTVVAPFETVRGHEYSFPLRYGDEWDLVRRHEFSGHPSVDSVYFVVDAWGTITDVAGEFNCLRLQKFKHSTEYEEEGIEINTEWEYIWLAEDFGEIVRITAEENEGDPDFTNGKFVRTTNVESVGVSHRNDPAIPSFSLLEPAYPNPFNPQTQLGFKIANPGPVQLNVFDLNGRVISRIANGYYHPGSYTASFNATGLSSGMYIVRFSSGSFNQTRTLMLTK